MALLNSRYLSGPHKNRLNAALRKAYRSTNALAMMLTQRLDRNLADYTPPGAENYEILVYHLIEEAEAHNFTAELLRAARESRPDNADLVAFAEHFGLVPIPDDAAAFDRVQRSLERLIQPHLPDLDIAVFRTGLGTIEGQIARLEVSAPRGRSFGTGFLLGPDVLITNYHVMEPIVRTAAGEKSSGIGRPEDVIVRFDYKAMPDGAVVSQGTTFGLATDWLIDASPYSPADLTTGSGGEPGSEELDYALLRLNQPVGEQKVGKDVADVEARPRGWLSPRPVEPNDFRAGQPLFIVQHPHGSPLKLTLGFDAMIGLNGNKSRVRYRTNTAPGSSGSPCFNERLELLALHHSGDPNFGALHVPGYNQGIPFGAILALLKQRGKDRLLG